MFCVCLVVASADAVCNPAGPPAAPPNPTAQEGNVYGTWQGQSVSGYATPSYLGETGLLITPTALVQPSVQAAFTYHAIDSSPRRQSFYGATVGLLPGFEISALRMANIPPPASMPTDWRNETVLSGKYQVPLDTLLKVNDAPKLALGVFDISNDADRVWYAVVTDSVSIQNSPQTIMNLHLGLAKKDHGDGQLDGLFAGFDVPVASDLLLQGEYDGENLNAGLRYYPAKWISVDGSVVGSNLAWGLTASTGF
jgi:hypothetical protein